VSGRVGNEAAVDRALDALRAANARSAEVYLRESTSGSVEVKDGAIETQTTRGERGLGVRIVDDARLGFAYTSDVTEAGIVECVDLARAMARVTEPDPGLRVAAEVPAAADLRIHDPRIAQRDAAARAEAAFGVERAARETDPRITTFRKTEYSDGEATTVLATTAGMRGDYRESWCAASTSAVAAANGRRQIGFHVEGGRSVDEVDPVAIGRRAAEMAVRKLGARALETARMAIVLDPWMGQQLLGAITPMFSADNVQKGRSLFAGKVGQRVASEGITIVDDPRREGGARSAPFDGEGIATQRRTLVESGTLRGYLHSIKTAAHDGAAPTGNARRGSYGGPARIAPSNFHIAAGNDDPRALRRRSDRALEITALLNLHTIDPISGEFSLGVAGVVLERGEPAYPVEGITIAGNLTHLLNAVAGVGNDLTFKRPMGIGSPTLLIADISVGGTSR
jgi:PmbA protein